MNTKYPKIIEAAVEGGKIVRKYFGEFLELEEKSGAANFRTIADTESEAKILEILSKEYPEYEVFSEEAGHNGKKSDYKFVIDPLDGTNNFSLGIPNFSVSIALMKGKETIFGVVYQPILEETTWAEKGQGSWRGDQRLQVSSENFLGRSTIHYACGYHTNTDLGPAFRSSVGHSAVKRWMEDWSVAADLCSVAKGKTEAMINFDCELYDFAAGKLIALEAGAIITDFSGRETDDLCNHYLVSNCEKIHSEILVALSQVDITKCS